MSSDQNSNRHWMATWVFALTTLSLLTIVLILAPFLSSDAKHSISYEVIYWYELVLLVPAIIAVGVVMVCALRNGRGNVDSTVEEEEETRGLSKVFWAIFKGIAKYIEPGAIVLCGFASVVLPIFQLYSISSCVHMANNRMYNVRIASLFSIIVFSVVETIWLLGFQRLTRFINVTKSLNAIAIMLIILGNLVLCVRSILDTSRASTTRLYRSRNDSLSQHFFDVTLVFSKCSNNTEIADSGTILSVYRFAYSFPFQFGFLALKMIFFALFNDKKDSLVKGHSEMYSQDYGENKNLTNGCGCTNKYLRRLKEIVCVSLLQPLKWSHIVSPILVLGLSIPYIILIIHYTLPNTLKNLEELVTTSDFTKALNMHVISLVYTYIYAAVPIFTYFWLWKYQVKSKLDFNKCLLMLCAVGNIFLCLFEIVDSTGLVTHLADKTYEVFYMVSLVFRILGIYCQMIVIFDSHGFLEYETCMKNKKLCVHVRGVLIFLAYDNGLRWLIETILPAPALKQVYQVNKADLFGESNWWMIVKLFTPLVLLYRLLSSVMCFKLVAIMTYFGRERNIRSI